MAYLTHDRARRVFTGVSLFETVMLWTNTIRERHALKRMSYSRLEDLGIDPKTADREAARPFWDVRSR